MNARPNLSELVRYVEGELTQARAAEVEAHLETSLEVRTELDSVRQLIRGVAESEPALEGVDLLPAIRLEIAESRSARAKRKAWKLPWRWALGCGSAVAAAALLILLPGRPDEFRSKGASAAPASKWAGIDVYRAAGGRKAGPAGGSIHPDQGLAFSYRNGGPRPFTHVAIFGVDGRGRVFWYYPAWQNAAENPESVAILPTESSVDLPDIVHHQLEPGVLHLHALFTRQALRVAEIESRLGAGGHGFPGSDDQQIDLTVCAPP